MANRKPNLNMQLAEKAAKEYCAEHGFDYSRIDRISQAWDEVLFAVSKKDVIADGLKNDLDTLPDVVLYCGADFCIHETEHIDLLR